jgi:bifunctional DNA primase/polymerase-like protein
MMSDEIPPPPAAPSSDQLVLPDSLLTLETVEHTLDVLLAATLWPILVHAPIGTDGGCTCGKVHQKSANGSSSAGKHPIAKSWQNRVASRDELLDQLARLKFVPNVGVVLGKQPSGHYLIAVDVDDMARFTALELELGALPETPRCDSGRGYRLFYEMPHSIDTATVANVTGLGGEPGLDVKVKAGQVVVAPSIHASGRQYIWTKTGPVAKLPMAWALELVSAPPPPEWAGKYTPSTLYKDNRARNRAEKYLDTVITGNCRAIAACGVGMRNSTLFKLACRTFEVCADVQLSRSWDHVHSELLSAAKASGLSDHEVRSTLANADRRVRESGRIRIPVVLQDPDPARQSVPPPPKGAPVSNEDGYVPPLPDDAHPYHPTTTSSGRRIIEVTTELYDNCKEAISALAMDDEVYQREKRLVHVAHVTREESDASPHIEADDGKVHRQLIEGSPQIRLMTRPLVKSHLSKIAVFQKYVSTTGKMKPIIPPDDIVGTVHDIGEWPGVRPIVGVAETPIFCPGGIVMQTPGYDPNTCYLYEPSEVFPPIHDEDATQEQARWAYGLLSEIFCDFPYINDSHKAVAVAAILSLVARPAIAGSIPAFLFDASTRGSGKTLQTDAIATVTTGRGAPRMNYTSDDVELEKILAGYALKGSPFICLDNVPTGRPFGGGPLDRVLTARDPVDLRVLGGNNIPTLPWRAVIMATGNNMSLYGDTARRVLMARLEPKDESPERRTSFKHDDLLAWVRAQRPRLVSAALLLLRAYHRADRPDMGCARWGSFEEWSRLIPHAIVFAGGADPMKARPEKDEDVDVEAQALACLLDQLPKLHMKLHQAAPDAIPPPEDSPGLAARTILMALYDQKPEWSEFEAFRDAIELICKVKGGRNPDSTSLGYKLRSMRSRLIGGKKLVGKPGADHVMMWKVV